MIAFCRAPAQGIGATHCRQSNNRAAGAAELKP